MSLKIDKLNKERTDLIKEYGNIEMKLYAIDKEIEKTEKHNIASAKWYKKLNNDKRKIRNLKHSLKYYENKVEKNRENMQEDQMTIYDLIGE